MLTLLEGLCTTDVSVQRLGGDGKSLAKELASGSLA